MDHEWQLDDLIVYRLPDDPPGVWREAGTLAQLESEWRLQCQQGDLHWLVQEVAAANTQNLRKVAPRSAFTNARLN